jgi:2-desacetyl-2-hydroxyethyl bacteriochlorophyllide A dehydrogenase
VKSGRIVIFPQAFSADLEEFTIPQPGPNQVLVEAEFSCISVGTETKRYMDRYADSGVPQRPFPVRPGYASVGTVVEVGSKVESMQPGERVLTMANHASHYLRTIGEDAIDPVPHNVPSDQAALGVLAQVALAGVRRAPPEFGQAALVAGQGVVGQMLVQFLKAAGCSPVIATDIVDSRLDRSRLSGADVTVNTAQEDVYTAVMAATGDRGIERIYDVTPVPDALPSHLRVAAVRGCIVILGGALGRVELNLYPDLFRRDLTLMGAFQPLTPIDETPHTPWTQRRHRRLYLDMLAGGKLRTEHLITHVMPPAQASATYAMLAVGGEDSLGVLFDWRAGAAR